MRRQLLILLALICASSLTALTLITSASVAGTLSGTVKDPNGAVIVGAEVAVRNEVTGETRTATTDGEGRFKIEGLAPGRYTVSIARNGFKTAERSLVIEDTRTATLEVKLEVAETRAEVGVGAKGAVAANSDPHYRALRDGAAGETYAVSNLNSQARCRHAHAAERSAELSPASIGARGYGRLCRRW